MIPRRLAVDDLAAVLPPGGLTWVQGCATESALLAEAVAKAGAGLGAMTFAGIFVPGLNRQTYFANPECRVRTFFMTPELRAAGPATEFLPFCYGEVLAYLRATPIDAALFMVSPPDEDGVCSFGPTTDFLPDLWPRIPVRIAHINPAVPRTRGAPGIPFKDITAFIEAEAPLLGMAEGDPGATARAIAEHIQPFVPDGATLQTGLGKIPGAVLQSLRDRKNLRMHTGLAGDDVLGLLEAGAMAPGVSVTTCSAIGSERLYAAAEGEAFNFQPVSFTHSLPVISAIPNFVAINSALEVDLFGQAYAELTPKGLASGPGGASDFARAAKAGGGLRIVALPSGVKGGPSRISPPGTGAGPVSLSRWDIDVVVTEHGAADLRGLGHEQRGRALIAVADPQHREVLDAAWKACVARL